MKKILIVDYIVGGGFAEEDLPLDRLSEGYSILRSCIQQFSQLGFQVSTLIDHRLMEHIRISPIHQFESIASHEDFLMGIKTFADEVDYTLTSAPETKGILKDLSSIMNNSKSTYLGSKPDSIEIAADKMKTVNLAKELGLNIPATFSPSYNNSFEKILKEVEVIGFPLIVKPIDGVGCLGLTKVTNPDELSFGLQYANSVTNMENCLVQEFIEGIPISTSLLVNGENVYPISINHQNLRMDSKKSIGHYLGGQVPYDIPELRNKILKTAVKLVEQMDLSGYIGVDFIATKEDVFVIEVNPRITVPFIAINNIASSNVSSQLISIVEKGKIDNPIKLNGYASFSKITIPSTIKNLSKYEKVAIIDGVLSPPFPLGNNTHSYALILGIGPTVEHARKDFQRIKNELLFNLSS